VITVITIDTLTKFFPWKEIDHLRENSLALVHNESPFAFFMQKNHETGFKANSNRSLSISSLFNINSYS